MTAADARVQVVDLTDIAATGGEDPLSSAIYQVLMSSARLSGSVPEMGGAVAALAAMKSTVQDEMPLFGDVLAAVLRLLSVASDITAEACAAGE